MAAGTLEIFLVWKKVFLTPFSYLLSNFSKLKTKIFGLIRTRNQSPKILHFVKRKPIYMHFILGVSKPNIAVLEDRLFLTRIFCFLTRAIRTPQDEHFELSYAKIGLKIKKLQSLENFQEFDFEKSLPVIFSLFSFFSFFKSLHFIWRICD